ncbi:MAG: MerR family transcriptional regulator [Bacteroidetes bacterium]|jgi:MerR family transcriptional regulator, light-induced transcriptional regulator|nr:MerR family transcriptional regulator [Bacteroidota bacterium]
MNSDKYSIRDLEKLTGIKAHTIRVWEKRYDIIHPERTDTNIRYYTDKELQRLLNISILNRSGYKISHISEMSDEEIITSVAKLSESNELVDADINSMLVAAVELSEDNFERVLNACLIKFGFERTFYEVIFPLFDKIGIMWQIGKLSSCQERFISNLIRQKLLVAIDALVGSREDLGSFLLFMPADHENEIGLLFANYIIRKRGYQVVYLGPSVPFTHLKRLGSPERFQHIFVNMHLSLTALDLKLYIKKLRTIFSKQNIHVSLSGEFPKDLSSKLENIAFYPDLKHFAESQF